MTATCNAMFLLMGTILIFEAGTALAAMNACHKCVTNSSGMSKQIKREVQNMMLNHGLWLPWSYTIDGCANPIDERSNIPVVSSCYSPCYKLSISIKSKDDEEHRLVARGCRDQLIEPKLTKIYPSDATCYTLEFRTNGDDKLKDEKRGHLRLIQNVSSILCYCRGRLCNGIREDRRSDNQNLSREKPQRYLLQKVADDSIDSIPNNGHQYGHMRTPSYAHIVVLETPSSHELVTFHAAYPTSATSRSTESETFAVIEPSEEVMTASTSYRDIERIAPTTFTTQIPEFGTIVDALPVKSKAVEEIENKERRGNTDESTEFLTATKQNNQASNEETMKHPPETNPQTTTSASTTLLTTISGFETIQRPAPEDTVSIVTHSAGAKANSDYTIAYPYQETRGSHSSESESNENFSIQFETFSQPLTPLTTTIPITTSRRTVDIEIVRGTILPNISSDNDNHRYVYYGEPANSAEINHRPSKSAEIFIRTNGPLATTPSVGEFVSKEVLQPPQSPTMSIGVNSPDLETSLENEKKSTVVQISSESSESQSKEVKHSPSAVIIVSETPTSNEANKKTTLEIAFSGETASVSSSEILKHSVTTNWPSTAVVTATASQGSIDSTQSITAFSSTYKPKNSFEDHFATHPPATTKSNSKGASAEENFFVVEESLLATTPTTRRSSKSQEREPLTTTLPNVSDYHDYSSAEVRAQSETTTEGFQPPSYRHEVVDEILNELYALHAGSSFKTTSSPRRSEMNSASASAEFEENLKHSTSSSKENSYKSTETFPRMYSDASVDVLLETTTASQNANQAKLSIENVSEKSTSAESANLDVEVVTTSQPSTTAIPDKEAAEVVDFLKSFIHVVSSIADEVTAAEQTHTVTMYTNEPEQTTEKPVPATAKIMVLQLLEVPSVNLTRVKVDYKPETSTEKAVVTRALANRNDASKNPNVSIQKNINAPGQNSGVPRAHAASSFFPNLFASLILLIIVL